MSEIRTATISDLAGTGPATLTKQSAAKAWVNFNGTGTVAIRDSFNVASLTDNGTGDYSLVLTSAMDSGDYAVTALTCIESGEADMRTPALNLNRSFNTTNFGIKTMIGQSTDTDRSQVHANVDGDLA